MNEKEIEFTGEFVIPGKVSETDYQRHMGKYAFASRFVKDKIKRTFIPAPSPSKLHNPTFRFILDEKYVVKHEIDLYAHCAPYSIVWSAVKGGMFKCSLNLKGYCF